MLALAFMSTPMMAVPVLLRTQQSKKLIAQIDSVGIRLISENPGAEADSTAMDASIHPSILPYVSQEKADGASGPGSKSEQGGQVVLARLQEDGFEEDDYQDDYVSTVVDSASATPTKQTKQWLWAEHLLVLSQIVGIGLLVGPLLFYQKQGAIPSEHAVVIEDNAASIRVPTSKLAMTALVLVFTSYTSACLVVHGVKYHEYSGIWRSGSCLAIVQCLWNAGQVCHLLLLMCFLATSYTRSAFIFCCLSFVLLPMSLYVTSPGGHAFAFIACGFALVQAFMGTDVELVIWEGSHRLERLARCSVYKFCSIEELGFTCNLLCSMYNYHASPATWPYWLHIFKKIGLLSGLAVKSSAIAENMYSLGWNIELPTFVPSASGDNVGTLVFVMTWSFLPFLYVLYFLATFIMSTSMSRVSVVVQRGLCIFGMFHFLFLTDGVDYKYGRGMKNPKAEWCHWSERFAWRIALLLPVYQKIAKSYWKRCHSNVRVGSVIHWLVALWSIVFLAYQVLLHDVPYFSQWVVGRFSGSHHRQSIESLITGGNVGYSHALGYHGALVLMTLLYGFSMLGMTGTNLGVVSVRASDSAS